MPGVEGEEGGGVVGGGGPQGARRLGQQQEVIEQKTNQFLVTLRLQHCTLSIEHTV